MSRKYNGNRPSADYAKIIPEYYDIESNSVQMSKDEQLESFVKQMLFDSMLTETAKNFPAVKGLENNEQWLDMVTTVIDSYAIKGQNGRDLEWVKAIHDSVNQMSPGGNVKQFKPPYITYLAAALILLSVISISVFLKKLPSEKGVNITSNEITKDISNRESDLVNDSENRTINKGGKCTIIDLDSGSRAFIDSGALVSNIKIEDKKVLVSVLKGAVSFSVAKKKQRSFIVKAGLADIVVTGTKFRVVRMEDLVTVAVINGSVNTMYNNGAGKVVLTDRQVAMVMKDTVVVLKNDSVPDLPERKLLSNFLNIDEDLDGRSESISKSTADSLLDIMFTSGLSFAAEGDLIEHFSSILESKGKYKDALTVLKIHPQYENNRTSNEKLAKLRYSLLLKTGDTATAVSFMKCIANDKSGMTNGCDVLGKLYKLYLKSQNLQSADSCLHLYVECNQKKDGMDKVIIEHAHQLRNALMIDAALFWYEYLLENFAESKYRKDAEYWLSDCVVQKSIGKNSALNNKSTSSGR